MTLWKQLILGLSVVFMVILIGLLWLNVDSTRSYLQEQLASHAQDAATALSIPMSQALAREDMVLARTQAESMFDRGYFKQIIVLNNKDQPLLRLALPDKVEAVPSWFTRFFALDPSTGQAFVSSGWRQLGRVVVESKPEQAYQYLWSNALRTGGWIALAYLLSLAMIMFVLKLILNPLYAIEHAAQSIQERRFIQIPLRPRARELARVVRAMNDMSRRIAAYLDELMSHAEGYRRQAMQDELTRLDNRRSFDMQMEDLSTGDAPISSGLLMGVEIQGLKEINTVDGYQRGNGLLVLVADTARGVLGHRARVMARLGGASFGFVFSEIDKDEASQMGARLQGSLREAMGSYAHGAEVLSFSMGSVTFSGRVLRADLMSRLDMAIASAGESGLNQWHELDAGDGSHDAFGSTGWRDLIQGAINEGRWSLFGQDVLLFADGGVLHTEVMGRLIDRDGGVVPAARFIPMSIRHGLMARIDRSIIAMIIDRLRASDDGLKWAVNVSAQSLESREFTGWLHAELKGLGGKASQLAFEISCFGCHQYREHADAFMKMVREHGAVFGIDRLGLAAYSMEVLRDLPPDYVKLEGELVVVAHEDAETMQWLHSLITLARGMGVLVIAQGIEGSEQLHALKQWCDAGQGHYLSSPGVLD